MYHQHFLQEYIAYVSCTSFLVKGIMVCALLSVQVRFLDCRWWQERLRKALQESWRYESLAKAVANNTTMLVAFQQSFQS